MRIVGDVILDLGLLMVIGERGGVGCGIEERVIRIGSLLDIGVGGGRMGQRGRESDCISCT
jgi:hypothetical protein